MKSLTHGLFDTFVFIFVFVFSCLVIASETISPEDVVSNFYREYLNNHSGDSDAIVKKYVSDELIKSVSYATMCNYDRYDLVSVSGLEQKCSQKHECRQYKWNYICKWYGIWIETDVDYFTKSQDTYPFRRLNIKSSIIAGDENDSLVGIILKGDYGTEVKLKASLKKHGGNWKITKVTE